MARAIEVGQAHAGLIANSAHRLLVEADDRRHAAGTGLARLLHQLAPATHHAKPVLETKRISRGQRGELAQRQAGGRVERQRRHLLVEQLKRDPADEIDRRLRVLGAHQFLLRAGKTNPAQAVPKRLVGLGKQRLGCGVRLRQVVPHPDNLGPLPGKQQRSLHHVPEVNPKA